jgi:probable F420-dependent oxidoreductase
MTHETGYGITFPAMGLRLCDQLSWLRAVESAGYTSLWSGEAMVADAFAMLAAASVVAPSMHLGTAVVPAFTRAPGLLAVSAATLAALAPGRCSIGVGASSATVVQSWGGVPYDRPYQRTRDVVRFLRAALTGARISQVYETFSVDGFCLPEPPPVAPNLLIAALRPGMLALAGREADGAVLTWASPTDVARMVGYVGSDNPQIVVWVSVCPSTDVDRIRDQVRPLVAEYLNVPGYAAFQEWLGRGDQLRPMWTAWSEGRRRDAVAAVPDAVIDELIVHGSPQRCRERLAEYTAAGATTLALSILPGELDPIDAARSIALR